MVRKLLAGLDYALRHWDQQDPTLARLARSFDVLREPARRRPAFAMLVESLVHQQVSLAAGRTIYARLGAVVGGRITPEAVLEAGGRRLRRAGVSRQKRDYVLDLARRVQDGRVDFRTIARADDDQAIATLTELRGVGEWTAKMFLLFHLERPDVVAEGDLGLQLAAADAYGIALPKAKKFLLERRPVWSPYGSLASLVLWRSRDGK